MKLLEIGILSQSYILAQGLIQLLQSNKKQYIRCHALSPGNITDQIIAKNIRILIADPLHPTTQQLLPCRNSNDELAKIPLIALCSGLIPMQLSSQFDAVITAYDTPDNIYQAILSQNTGTDIEDNNDRKSDLTSREKEIVVGIVKGLSNKEIASEINVSVNTVMTHRRNIASKLQIHSPAGLTIYAIVSKLVSIDEIKHSIN